MKMLIKIYYLIFILIIFNKMALSYKLLDYIEESEEADEYHDYSEEEKIKAEIEDYKNRIKLKLAILNTYFKPQNNVEKFQQQKTTF